MTKTEIIERINELEKLRFYLSMKDLWDSKDYDTDRKWFNEWLTLTNKLKAMED